MEKYLVTGAAGFIGSNIVEKLLQQGDAVRVLDNLSTGKQSNIDLFGDRIEFLKGDIRNPEDCRKAVRGMDYVLHQAALASVPRSVKDPVESNDVNINGTLNVLIAARDEGIKRVVYAASSSAYGDSPKLPKEESMTPNPLSPYAINKLVGEYYCRVFTELYGLETVALRYFNVFGPRQDPKSEYAAVVPKFITLLLAGQSPEIYGDGEQSRDFTYVDNVVAGNLLAVKAPQAPGKMVNLACGGRYTLNELGQLLKEIIGSDAEIRHGQPRAGDVQHSCADIERAKNILGFEVKVSFEEGLKKTVAWYREQEGARA
jgi:nucleoside-diphosphate-sugar epimerase